MVCPKCGLPEELCECESIAKEQQKITVTIVKRRYGKTMTIIKGIDPSNIDVKDLFKKMKGRFACGGTVKNDEIELQGDHRHGIKKFLEKEGFPPGIVEVM